jgi:tetratricopeptide (TPR) repeat protein
VVDYSKARNAYEMAVAAVPPVAEKRFWQRYVYLWIKYALFEELVALDVERTREVYRTCLKLIPHASFTFAKVWVLAAQFEVRQRRLDAARKIFGMAIGMCPKNKLFRSYIEMELSLGNVDRCRTLYEKFLEFNPVSAAAWGQWAELETALGETERARALYEIAISQEELDMPEAMWKAYIDHEIAEGSRVNARGLYERLLEKTQHVKVWMSYAKMESTPLKILAAEQEGGPCRLGRDAHGGNRGVGRVERTRRSDRRIATLWRAGSTPEDSHHFENYRRMPRRRPSCSWRPGGSLRKSRCAGGMAPRRRLMTWRRSYQRR